MKAKNALSLLLAAGMVAPAVADTNLPISPKGVASGARIMGHIYVNVATGEKIGTNYGAAPRGALPPEVWMADNDVPCADVNSTGVYDVGFVGFHDDPADTTDTAFNATYLNWGDVAADTVVDTIQVTAYATHADVDSDGDGLADGVEGLGCTWSFVEGDNGFNSCTTRLGLIGITLIDLPGTITAGAIEGYIFTLDLAGDFSEDISFEIGDTDGDLQGAAVHNAFANAGDALDLDVDGLTDFAYGIRYIQPGTADFDGDGINDGDPSNVAVTYSQLSAPRMVVNPNPPTTFTIDPISAGNEDAFDIIVDPLNDGSEIPFGTFWYGGFSCDRDGNGIFEGNVNSAGQNDYRPYASYFMAMYAGDVQPPECRQDINNDGILNFFDISTFIALFNAQDPQADFFPVAAGDGLFNFFDLSDRKSVV